MHLELFRIPLLLGLLVAGAIGLVAISKGNQDAVPMDMGPTDRALGEAAGTWLQSQHPVDIVVVDTQWEPPHLVTLATARAEGLKSTLGTFPCRWVLAKGPTDQLNAWNQAVASCTKSTVLVSFFGMPGKGQVPTSYAGVLLVGTSESEGLPARLPISGPWRVIKPRQFPTAPVGNPTWKGTSSERFQAFYEVRDHPANGSPQP